MGRGITITIKRMIDVRDRRKDDRSITIWTGTRWTEVGSVPWPPGLAADCGVVPEAVTTPIEFPPPGVVTDEALLYQKTLLPKMRAMGIIR